MDLFDRVPGGKEVCLPCFEPLERPREWLELTWFTKVFNCVVREESCDRMSLMIFSTFGPPAPLTGPVVFGGLRCALPAREDLEGSMFGSCEFPPPVPP